MCDSPYQACSPDDDELRRRRRTSRHDAHSEIGLLDVGVLRHRRIVALGEHAPARQHGDAIGEIGDDLQIVLDHQDRAVGGDAPDQRGDAVDVLVAHARHRLVEQQHFRIERERGGDLQRALAAIGDFAGDAVGEFGEADVVEQFHRARVQRR